MIQLHCGQYQNDVHARRNDPGQLVTSKNHERIPWDVGLYATQPENSVAHCSSIAICKPHNMLPQQHLQSNPKCNGRYCTIQKIIGTTNADNTKRKIINLTSSNYSPNNICSWKNQKASSAANKPHDHSFSCHTAIKRLKNLNDQCHMQHSLITAWVQIILDQHLVSNP